MERTFELEKFSGGITKWKKKFIIISKDEIAYANIDKKDKIIEKYHISSIKKIVIIRDIDKPYLLIEIDSQHSMKLSTNEKNYSSLNDIKNILNVKKVEYFINIFRFKYMLEILKCFNIKEFEINISNYISDSSYNDIKKSFDKNKEKLKDLSERIIPKYNKLIDFNNEGKKEEEKEKYFEMTNFIDILPSNHINQDFNTDQIKKLGETYDKLINLLSFFKKRQLMNYYKLSSKDDKMDFLTKEKNNENNKNTNNNNNLEENKLENQEKKLKKISEENLILRDKLMTLLNQNSTIKEDFKKKLNKENFKMYFCYNCNNLLKRTSKSDSTCNFDKKCNKNSIFYCRKCKIHYCTYCINYQRNLKCSKNHSFFPVIDCHDKNYKCLICDSKTNIPFYVCSHCKEEICSKCSNGIKEKEKSCYICNNELTWKKSIYSQCNKCNNYNHCFWNCCSCDFSMCLNCYPILSKKCGAFHDFEIYNLDLERNNFDFYNNDNFEIMFFNNFELKFFGKCSKCRKSINCGIVYCCLRCMLFLCSSCFKDID